MESFDKSNNLTSSTNHHSITNVVSADSDYEKISLENYNLTDWQKSQIHGVSQPGVDCMLRNWFSFSNNTQEKDPDGHPQLFCNGTWDEIYCWPPVRAGETIIKSCAEVMQDEEYDSVYFKGNAFRICSENGSWLWGNWTNYKECMVDIESQEVQEDRMVVHAVRYILFIGSILSLLCLAVSLFIFFYFKSLRCDRITVHVHLMCSLTLRFIMLIVITEPFIFQRTENYREVDWICKAVLFLQLYSTISSINWMFVQGHYLHARLTTNVFDRGTPFKIYYAIAWVFPMFLIGAWTFCMEKFHPVHCWRNYGDLTYIWIIVGPMIVALFVNLLFLVNIMRILLTKIQRANTSTDSEQFRRAVKATVILFPLLGINNLLFFWNPGGSYEDAYMITNTICQSSQGIMVSILYCFISSDVRDAIRREYRRFSARRSANSIKRTQSRKRSGAFNFSVKVKTPSNTGSAGNSRGLGPGDSLNPPKHFKTKFKSTNNAGASPSPDAETRINFLNDTPSPTSSHHNGIVENPLYTNIDSHTVVIPLKDLR